MSQQPTDKALIGRVLRGETRAYAILVDRYQHMVFTLAVRVLGREALAEETAQDVFIKAFESLGTFKGQAKFSTWLYRIAYHRSLDVLDREKRNRLAGAAPLESLPGAGENTTWNTLLAQDRGVMVRELLARLDPEDRAVLTLHYLQELSLKEVGEVMGLRPDTVKVRLHRARKRLKALVGEDLQHQMVRDYGT